MPSFPLGFRPSQGANPNGPDSYSFFTLIMRERLPDAGVNSTSTADAEGDPVLDGQRIAFHENTHWLQHVGTTTGAMFSLLKFAQERLTVDMLCHFPRMTLQALVERRRDPHAGHPIVRLVHEAHAYELPPEFENTPDLDSFAKLWTVYWRSLLLWYCADSTQRCPPDFFGLAIRSAIRILQLNGRVVSDHGFGEDHFVPADGRIGTVKYGKESLTTYSINEAAAVAHELMYVEHCVPDLAVLPQEGFIDSREAKSWLRSQAALRLKKLEASDHRQALDLFSESAPSGERNWFTFAAVCDLALNPPVPPVVLAPALTRSPKWEDIYPPMRFVRCVNALPRVKAFDTLNTHTQATEFAEDLAAAAGLPLPSTYYTSAMRDMKTDDFGARTERGDSTVNLDSKVYYDYLLWAQSSAWTLRQDRATLFTCTGFERALQGMAHGLMASAVRAYGARASSCKAPSPFDHHPCLYPPIILREDGRLIRVLNEKGTAWLLANSASYYALFDVVRACGCPDLAESYGPLCDGSKLAKAIHRNLSEVFKVGDLW